ncbi:MAG: flagellar motor switch protein FliG [Deltaproteobacteria bacterium]|nr:flagellar motor switch protein FliG [Deltaproteobacteria bacterium]
MNNFMFNKRTFFKYISILILLMILKFELLDAEYLSRSRPEPELRERIHKILRKALREEYIDVSVVLHSFLDNEPVKKESDLVPGVKIATEDKDVQTILNYRTIILTVNNSIDLDQIEQRVRSEVSELKSQDRFEQSVVLEKLTIERPDFSSKLVEYVNLLVDARSDLNKDEPASAQEKLKRAVDISSAFPPGYEMLGVEELIPEFEPEGTDAITPAQWAILGTLAILLLLTLVLFFFVSRSTREKEEEEHPLQDTLGKVATAIEAMAPEEEEEEEELALPEEEAEGDEDEEKIDYFGFINRMPKRVRIDLLKEVKPHSQAIVFSQMEPGDMADILKALPEEDALGIVLTMKDIKVTPNELQELADELAELAKKLPMPFDGLGRVGELSGQISSDQWKDILGSADELKKKNPELAALAKDAVELIRERSLSFEDLENSEFIDEALVSRVMEKFERSRLVTGAKVSVPYILLDSHTSVIDKIMKEYPEDTKKYYNEQLEGFEKERNEDEESKTRIEQIRDLHRNVFMRHVHVELGKIWEKQEVEA